MSTERTITCRELTEVVNDYLEGVMPAADRVRFDAHLELCEGCVNYVSQMRQTIRAVGALDPGEVEATVPDDVLAAFRAWRRGDPIPGS
jgi:predicted anti-sigma-YlaC factor YlaD